MAGIETTGPNYANVRKGGPHGIRYPLEVKDASLQTVKAATINYGGAHADYTLSPSEAGASLLLLTNAAGGGGNLLLAVAHPGRVWVVQNASTQTITFKVAGATGIAVANAKTAIVYCHATDIQRATADTTYTS